MQLCGSCGAPLDEQALFCSSCGAAVPTPPRPAAENKKTGGLSLPFLLLGFGISLLLTAGFVFLFWGRTAQAHRMEGPGFSTAVEAAEAYARALEAGDLEAMLSTFAQESYVRHLDKEEMLSRTSFSTTSNHAVLCFLPQSDELPLAVNAAVHRGAVVEDIFTQYRYCLPHTPNDLQRKNPASPYYRAREEQDLRELMDVLRAPSTLCSAKLQWIRPLEELAPETFSSLAEIRDNYRRSWGAEELKELLVCVRINGEDYGIGLVCGRYEDKWYNITLRNPWGAVYGYSYSALLTPLAELDLH